MDTEKLRRAYVKAVGNPEMSCKKISFEEFKMASKCGIRAEDTYSIYGDLYLTEKGKAEVVKMNLTFPSGTYNTTTNSMHTKNATLDTDETAFCHGYMARAQSLGLGSNPYTPMTAESISWALGWMDADGDSLED